MYAIIKTGGKQYRVEEGASIRIERIEGEVGDEISFDDVLLIGGEDGVQAGQEVGKAQVTGTIAEQGKGRKVIVFKFKRRKMFRRKRGHRQHFTRVDVGQIKT